MAPLPSLRNLYTQSFPPGPTFTEKECPNLTGRVYFITGGTSGIGLDLASILFSKNATVYITGRSRATSVKKGENLVKELGRRWPASKGVVRFLVLDAHDLRSVKPCVERFFESEGGGERRLHGLWCNAGVMAVPVGERSEQNHELHLAIHCLSHLLLIELLLPTLRSTASTSPPGTVRVCWPSTIAIENFAPNNGIDFKTLDHEEEFTHLQPLVRYAQSKVGAYFLSCELARREKAFVALEGKEETGAGSEGNGVVSLCYNPGNVMTNLQKHMPAWQVTLVMKRINKSSVFGAYTALFAGVSPVIVARRDSGGYVIPFGRLVGKDGKVVRADIERAARPLSKGVGRDGKAGEGGKAEEFWDWCQERIGKFR